MMTFERTVEELLGHMKREGIDVATTPTGGLLSRSNGCRPRVFVELVGDLHRAHREDPERVRDLVERRERLPEPVPG
jgi:hypothetical protein